MTLSAETVASIEQARDRYPEARSAILPALWAVQHEVGLLTPDAMGEVAALLRVAPSEVEAVSTFYSMYFQHPHGRHEVLVCINVSCALRGADDVVSHLERSLGCPSGATTADGEFTWASTVECLGACGGAPAMQVDHHFHENLTPVSVDAILGRVRGTDGHTVAPATGSALGAGASSPATSVAAPAPATDAAVPATKAKRAVKRRSARGPGEADR